MGKITNLISVIVVGAMYVKNKKLREDNKDLREYKYGRKSPYPIPPRRDYHKEYEDAPREIVAYTFDTKESATGALEHMALIAERYGEVKLTDYYRIIDMEDEGRLTDRLWGWTYETIRNAAVKWTKRGYTIIFPEPVKLERI